MSEATPHPTHAFLVERLPVEVYASNAAAGAAAAAVARRVLREAIQQRGEANMILATGNSQLAFLQALSQAQDVDWSRVRLFHMDQYVGLDDEHPASFPRFLRERFLSRLPVAPLAFHPVEAGAADPDADARAYEALLRAHPADLVACGFGENGHLAFNDPPGVRFDDPAWVKVVPLAEASRRQQVGEGHFPDLAAVPTHAVTLTVPALLAPGRVLCIVPEARKAQAVHDCLLLPVSEDRPGSALRGVDHATLYLDPESAASLPQVR